MKKIFIILILLLVNQITFSKELKIQEIWYGEFGYAEIKTSKGYGIIDENGKIIIEPINQYVGILDKNLFLIENNKKSKIINIEGKTILDNLDDIISPWNEKSNYLIVKNKKIGVLNRKLEKILNYNFDGSYELNKDFFALKKNNKWALFNFKGEQLTKFEFDDFTYEAVSENKFGVQVNNKWTYVNEKGEKIADLLFDYVSPFSENCALIRIKKEWYIFSEKENTLIKLDIIHKEPTLPTYDKDRGVFINELMITDAGVINKKGQIVYKNKYDDIERIGVNFLVDVGNVSYLYDEKFNLIKKLGEAKVDFGCIINKNNNKYGLLNDKGEILLPYEFDSISYLTSFIYFGMDDGYFQVEKNGKYAIVNKDMKFINEYSENNYIQVVNGFISDSHGIKNFSGKVILETIEDAWIDLSGFAYGNFCVIKEGDKIGIVNKNGKITWLGKYDDSDEFQG